MPTTNAGAGWTGGRCTESPSRSRISIDVAGWPTTAASRVLDDRPARRDATVTIRLREAGAILIGKTNLHEFALGVTSEDSAFGPVHHPADPERSPGGSSGGSAAAVAAGMGLASIGTDTGGSIRIPAAACGVVGLKPGYGEVPTAGVVPLSPSLDHVGPLARTVADTALVWSVLVARRFERLEPPPVRGLRLRQLAGYFAAPVDSAVRVAMDGALERLRVLGASIGIHSWPDAGTIPATYTNIVLPEGALWHEAYLATRAEQYSPAVRERFESGRTIPAVAYLAARQARARWRRAVDDALDGYDALLLPTLPVVAPRLGDPDVTIDADPPVTVPVRQVLLRQTQLFDLTGHPAISLPLRTPGLPVGLQLVGRLGDTDRLLNVAAACEQALAARGTFGLADEELARRADASDR